MRRMPLNAGELDKYIILAGDFSFQTETLENVLTNRLYSKLALEIIECANKGIIKPAIIEDTNFGGVFIGELSDDYTARLTQVEGKMIKIVDINLSGINMHIELSEKELMYTTDTPKMYRHQLTITNQSNVSVEYMVYASNNLVINSLANFVEVTKADTNYTGLASYLDASGKVQPAFIRYSYGNVVIQSQNGSVSPMKSVSDIVTPI